VNIQKLIQDLKNDVASHKNYVWQREDLQRKGKLVISNDSTLRIEMLHWYTIHSLVDILGKVLFEEDQSYDLLEMIMK